MPIVLVFTRCSEWKHGNRNERDKTITRTIKQLQTTDNCICFPKIITFRCRKTTVASGALNSPANKNVPWFIFHVFRLAKFVVSLCQPLYFWPASSSRFGMMINWNVKFYTTITRGTMEPRRFKKFKYVQDRDGRTEIFK